jgi:hypothetical protein
MLLLTDLGTSPFSRQHPNNDNGFISRDREQKSVNNVDTFLATTRKGVARAFLNRDGGWLVESFLTDKDVGCLAVDPLSPGVVYAGTERNGVLRSDDRGITW